MKFCVKCGSAVGGRQSDCPRCGAQAFSATPPTGATSTTRRDRWSDQAPESWQGLASILDEGETRPIADVDLDLNPTEDEGRPPSRARSVVLLVLAVLAIVLIAMVMGYSRF